MARTLFWFCLCFIILFPLLLTAQTEVSGNVWGIWEASGSPYLVVGEIHVPTGSSLCIMPGCSVIFQYYYKFCVDSNAVLKAIGTEEDSIVFTVRDTSIVRFHGIRLYFTAPGCSLKYCRIEYGYASGIEPDNCGGGICCVNSDLVLSHSRISNNTATIGGGIYCRERSCPRIENSIIFNNFALESGGGCFFTENSSVNINNCVIANNIGMNYGGGLICERNSNSTICNTIFWLNTSDNGNDIFLNYTSISFLSYNNIDSRNCQTRPGSEIVWGSGNIFVNPMFVDMGSGDFRLQPGSECIDAGDPFSNLDEDETRGDIGAYGGTGETPPWIIGGEMTGFISPGDSPYVVIEEIIIPYGCRLEIQPGVTFQFHNHAGITVYGCLYAVGSVTDSIIFTNKAEDEFTGGIKFIESDSGSVISFCIVERGRNVDGGGIYCYLSNPEISHNAIRYNSATYCGGGIYCNLSHARVTNNNIFDNSADDYGGGICCIVSNVEILGNNITNNYTIRGGGIYLYDSVYTVKENVIISNTAGTGGGIQCDHFAKAVILNNIIAFNTASSNAGAIYCKESNIDIINNTVAYNSAGDYGGSILYRTYSKLKIYNTIFWGNTAAMGNEFYGFRDGIVADSMRKNILFVSYSNVDSVECLTESGSGILWAEGIVYGNPLFTSSDEYDFHLSATSPLIDAGDPVSRLDEDSTRNDMGAYGGKGNYYPGVLRGIIAGTLTTESSPYIVDDDIFIQDSETLTIEPGVILQFNNWSGLKVHGCLVAEGISSDSIIFTKYGAADYSSGIQFVYSDSGCILEFCRIQHGYNFDGGGIYCYHSKPIISNCKIISNSARYNGGGFYGTYSHAIICNNTFFDNYSKDYGGGVSFLYSDPILKGNIIVDNVAHGGGGAYFDCSSPILLNNLFYSNSASSGAGIFCLDHATPIILNCTFSSNWASRYAGGLYAEKDCTIEIANCIFGNNTATDWNEIYITWGYGSSTLSIEYSNIDTSECYAGRMCDIIINSGNVYENPMFVNPDSGDFRLQPDSPCIDAGEASVFSSIWDEFMECPDTDLDGNPRPIGGLWDLGAYEFVYMTQHQGFTPGWNLVSLVRDPPNHAISSLFPFSPLSAFGYLPNLRLYKPIDTLSIGTGYWVLSLADTLILIGGEEILSFSDTLYPGWNLIGSLSLPMPTTELAEHPAIIPPVYGYSTADLSYEPSDFLMPGKGYWVLSSDTLIIIISVPDSTYIFRR